LRYPNFSGTLATGGGNGPPLFRGRPAPPTVNRRDDLDPGVFVS